MGESHEDAHAGEHDQEHLGEVAGEGEVGRVPGAVAVSELSFAVSLISPPMRGTTGTYPQGVEPRRDLAHASGGAFAEQAPVDPQVGRRDRRQENRHADDVGDHRRGRVDVRIDEVVRIARRGASSR